MTPVAGFLEQFGIKEATIGKATAIAWQTFIGLCGSSRAPWPIHKKWGTFLTIHPGGVVLTVTDLAKLYYKF
jgi:hypothetical protein